MLIFPKNIHTNTAEKRKANSALYEAANLLQSEQKGLINLLQCLLTVYYLFLQIPIKGTKIGSLALPACSPKSLHEQRRKSLGVEHTVVL